MTEPREPTLKQWKRRALQAEMQVDVFQVAQVSYVERQMRLHRELAALRVALKEAQEVINWALEQQT